MTKPVTVTVRGDEADHVRARAKAKGLTPEQFVARLIATDARQTARLKAGWADPERRKVLGAAISAGWAKKLAALAAKSDPAPEPEPTPIEVSNGHHA